MACTSDIKPEWAYAARELLAECAADRRLLGYHEFYNRLAPRCDWPAWRPGHYWVANYAAPTLMAVAGLNATFGEPMLSALVRLADPGASIGAGFSGAVFERYGVVPEDLQAFARVEAGKCFRFFGPPR